MASVAELLVRIGADVTQATNALKGFAAEANASMKRAEAGSVALAAGLTAVGAAVTAFAVSSIKDLANVERINAQTAAALKSTGAAAWTSVDQINGLATALENMSGVQAESIQAGENLLLTFTNIKDGVGAGNDIFTQATKVMLDMSVAMGTDASSGAIQLGKALNDPTQGITALSRVGVSFTQQQKDQIKAMQEAGDVAGAQKIILAELAKEFGGSAAAAGQTAIGVFNKMANALGDIGEAALTDAMPAIKDFGREITAEFRSVAAEIKRVGLAGTFESLVAPTDAAKIAVVALGGAITMSLVPSMGVAAKELWKLTAGLGPWALAGAAAAIVAYDLYEIWRQWPEVLDATKRSLDGYASGFKLLASILQGTVAAIELKVKQAFAAMSGYVASMVNGVKDWLGNKLKAAFDLVAKPIETAKKAFFGLYDAVVGHSYIPDMVKETGQHMAKLDQHLAAPAVKHTEAAKAAFAKLQADVSGIMSAMASRVAESAVEFKVTGDEMGFLSAKADAARDALRALFKKGLDETSGSVQAMRNQLRLSVIDLEDFKAAAERQATAMQAIDTDVKAITSSLGGLQATFATNAIKAGLLGSAFNEVKANADAIAGALPAMIEQLGATNPLVAEYVDQLAKLQGAEAVDAYFDSLTKGTEKANKATDAGIPIFKDIKTAISEWQGVASSAVGVVSTAMVALGVTTKVEAEEIGKNMEKMGRQVTNVIGNLASGNYVGAVAATLEMIGEHLTFGIKLFAAWGNAAKAAWAAVNRQDYVTTADGVVHLSDSLEYAAIKAGQLKDEMAALAKRASESARSIIGSLGSSIGDALTGKINLNEFERNFSDAMKGAVANAVQNAIMQSVVLKKLQPFIEELTTKLESGDTANLQGTFWNIASKTKEMAASLSPVLSGLKGALDFGFSSRQSDLAGTAARGTAGSMTQEGMSRLAAMGIPMLASGGITTGPTLAMIGEAGPEAVIPLDRMGGMGGNQINVTINATGNGEELGRLLVGELRRQGVRFA